MFAGGGPPADARTRARHGPQTKTAPGASTGGRLCVLSALYVRVTLRSFFMARLRAAIAFFFLRTEGFS